MKQKLEYSLADLFGFDRAVLGGNGRSLLCALLEVIAVNKTVLIPENICASVAIAIFEAGAVPVAVPVSPETGLPTLETLRESLDKFKAGVWMIPHLYGFVQKYGSLVQEYKGKGWFILENDTNAVRPTFAPDFQPDAVLASFGYSKVINAGGGGALISDDLSLMKDVEAILAKFSPYSGEAEVIETDIMLARRNLRKGDQSSVPTLTNLKQVYDAERKLVRFRWSERWGDNLALAIKGYHQDVRRRCDLRDNWTLALQGFEADLVPITLIQPVPWRLIRRAKTKRSILLQSLRDAKIDVGTNYGSLSKEIPANLMAFSKEDYWGDHVLNFWLEADYSKQKIELATNVIRKILS